MTRHSTYIWLILLLLTIGSAGVIAGVPGEGRPLSQTVGGVMPLFVQVAATGNVTIANPGTAVFDGITLPNPTGVTANYPRGNNETARRILLWKQTTSVQNGIYLFNGSSAAMTRVPDMDESAEFRPGTTISVIQGQTYGGHELYLANTTFPTVGITAISVLPRATSEPIGPIQDLTEAGQINCGPHNVPHRTVRVRSATAETPVVLASSPQILPGAPGQICYIQGADDVRTVTVHDDNGFWLDNLPDVTFGLDTSPKGFIYDADTNAWRLMTSGLSSASGAEQDTWATVHARGGRIVPTEQNPACIGAEDTMSECTYIDDGGVLIVQYKDASGQPLGRAFNLAEHTSWEWLAQGQPCIEFDGTGIKLLGACKPLGSASTTLTAVTAGTDNVPLFAAPFAVTLTGVACHYNGAAPSTPATFTLADGAGNAVTITGTNPTCAAPGSNATYAAITAGNSLAAGELLRLSTSNTPNPTTDTYTIHLRFTKD